jgi:adenosylcobinamide-phosphate synthase
MPGTSGSAAAVITLAVALDLLFGDPPNRWHPVAWMGGLLDEGRRRAGGGSSRALLLRGAVVIVVAASLAGSVGWAVQSLAAGWGLGGVIMEAIALKIAISIRNLVVSCGDVSRALRGGNLGEARRLVGYHLVSRPTADLDRGQVASAAIESAGENMTDAFAAPLACYLVFGLAGAYIYRTINTADAMFGYREGDLEYFGKVCARMDDLINLIPARIAAVWIVGSAALVGARTGGAWDVMLRDHRRTASPNAGWTMSAMAGALGVALEKPGAYRLGAGREPGPADIDRGVRLVLAAASSMTVAAAGWLLLRASSG